MICFFLVVVLGESEKRKSPLAACNLLNGPLEESQKAAQIALVLVPLHLCCLSLQSPLQILALDLLARLISFGFFEGGTQLDLDETLPQPRQNSYGLTDLVSNLRKVVPGAGARGSEDSMLEESGEVWVAGKKPILDVVVKTICSSFNGEESEERVQLQILKALLAAVTCNKPFLHGSPLLVAIRTTYNIYLHARTQSVGQVAQVTLTQMVHAIFSKVKDDYEKKDRQVERKVEEEKQIKELDQMPKASDEETKALDEEIKALNQEIKVSEKKTGELDDGPKEETKDGEEKPLPSPEMSEVALNSPKVEATQEPPAVEKKEVEAVPRLSIGDGFDVREEGTLTDTFVRDAYNVFMAMCKLSSKTLNEGTPAALPLRSKLLSLSLLVSICSTHMPLLVSVTLSNAPPQSEPLFVQAVKHTTGLWPSLQRNAQSFTPGVYEIALEGFFRVMQGMRHYLKEPIEIFFHQILLPKLESKEITFQQKMAFLNITTKICQSEQTLVELYLNYDCSTESNENIFERLVIVLSKLTQSKGFVLLDAMNSNLGQAAVLAIAPAGMPHVGLQSTSSHLTPPPERERLMKLGALNALVQLLQSLKNWANRDDRLKTPAALPQSLQPQDDPAHFVQSKQTKSVLKEGITRFNLKPAKGIAFLLEKGVLRNKEPPVVARFLLEQEGLSKTMIGEFLGDGDEWNVEVMHAFVDLMAFNNMGFVDAMRIFLQAFRLPGESQKIDRYI